MKKSGSDVFEINLDGVQTVQSYYFTRTQLPMLSICKSNIQFNLQALEALQKCKAIRMLVNKDAQHILIRPVHPRSKDAILWTNPEAKTNMSPELECGLFLKQLYNAWDWNPEYRYQTGGRILHSDKQAMLLFDFSEYEVWDEFTQVKGIHPGFLEESKTGGTVE